jgi:hypothetical protein
MIDKTLEQKRTEDHNDRLDKLCTLIRKDLQVGVEYFHVHHYMVSCGTSRIDTSRMIQNVLTAAKRNYRIKEQTVIEVER